MAEYRSKILIIGSGPAGYTAGIYAARAGLKPILISGAETGGQLTLSEEVENFPAFVASSRGPDLMEIMRQQALKCGVQMISDTVAEVEFGRRPFECTTENHNLFCADAVIIATGASAKWLGIPSETKYRGFGVSVCATCDGFFYRNKDVAVIGGGNSAVEEALYLTNFARSVTLIHRRDSLRAEQGLQLRLKHNPQVNIKYNCVVEEILGTDTPPLQVEGLRLKNVKNDKSETIKIDGVFVAIGHEPNSRLFRHILKLNDEGYIVTAADSCATNIQGIFAAGDVQDPRYRQAVIAAGSGAMAAMEAGWYLSEAGL